MLLPRRAIVRAAVEDAQRAGELRADIDPESAIDLLAGPFLARVFAGHDVGSQWRTAHFDRWWKLLRADAGA